jgi:hypothetical protein
MKKIELNINKTYKLVCVDEDFEVNVKIKKDKTIEINMPYGNIAIEPYCANEVNIKERK